VKQDGNFSGKFRSCQEGFGGKFKKFKKSDEKAVFIGVYFPKQKFLNIESSISSLSYGFVIEEIWIIASLIW